MQIKILHLITFYFQCTNTTFDLILSLILEHHIMREPFIGESRLLRPAVWLYVIKVARPLFLNEEKNVYTLKKVFPLFLAWIWATSTTKSSLNIWVNVLSIKYNFVCFQRPNTNIHTNLFSLLKGTLCWIMYSRSKA